MNKKVILVLIIFFAVLIFAGFKFFNSQTRGIGGLKISTNLTASVFLDDKLVGKTPFEEKLSTGEYVVKLIPEDSQTQAFSWQGKVNVNPNVLTYVNRILGASELLSSGEILTLEKIQTNEAQLSVFSQPDGAIVLIDGLEKGTTPLFINELGVGEHDITVTSPGFTSRTVRIQATQGFKLSVNFQLALSGVEPTSSDISPTVTATLSSEKTKDKKLVVIKDTPTGFLRVRSGPSTSASESAQVKPGEKFPLLEEKQGWFKILYDTDKEGWVSGRYVEVEQD